MHFMSVKNLNIPIIQSTNSRCFLNTFVVYSLVIALVHLVLAVSDVGQKSVGNTLGWVVQWQTLEVPESHGMTCTAKLRNWQLMPSLRMLSSTGGRSLCGTRQNRFKSKAFHDWVHQLISFLKDILSYHWQLTKPALGMLRYSSRIDHFAPFESLKGRR
jgi:hypothetical protein